MPCLFDVMKIFVFFFVQGEVLNRKSGL